MTILRAYGWRPDKPCVHDTYRTAPRFLRAFTLPSNVDLEPHFPGVYDQGQTGSCTGNSSGSVVEFLRLKQRLWDFTPSRLFIYYNGRALEGTTDQDAGAEIRDVISGLLKFGAPSEKVWAFDPSLLTVKPYTSAYEKAKLDLISGADRVLQTEQAIRSTLAGGEPIVFGITVYESFESEAVASSGIVPMPGTREQSVGGHAIVIVGYDHAKRMFKIRNSWGKGWGQRGYCWLPYDYVLSPDLADDFWVLNGIRVAA